MKNPTNRRVRDVAKSLKLTTDHSMSRYGIPIFVDPENTPLDYHDGIRRVRKLLDLSTDDLASIAGVSPRTVEGWEQGRPIPKEPLMLIQKFMQT